MVNNTWDLHIFSYQGGKVERCWKVLCEEYKREREATLSEFCFLSSFLGECFLQSGVAFLELIWPKTMLYFWTLYPVTTSGTGMLITDLRGWLPARRTHLLRTGSTHIPTVRSLVSNFFGDRSCLSRKSNWPTMSWIKLDRWLENHLTALITIYSCLHFIPGSRLFWTPCTNSSQESIW